GLQAGRRSDANVLAVDAAVEQEAQGRERVVAEIPHRLRGLADVGRAVQEGPAPAAEHRAVTPRLPKPRGLLGATLGRWSPGTSGSPARAKAARPRASGRTSRMSG